MKIKATKKELRNGFDTILGVSYCAMQTLLSNLSPAYYSTRIEGWACDYYVVENVLISTGYSPLLSRNINTDYNIINKFEKKAQSIRSNHDLSWQQASKKIEKLLLKLIKTLKGE